MLWDDLFKGIRVSEDLSADPLLSQFVNEKILETLVKTKFHVSHHTDATPTTLSDDECNALRYGAGYIPFKLLKRYYNKAYNHQYKDQYIACLSKMSDTVADVDDHNELFLEYTKRWVDQINLGGLFKVNDDVYTFFHETELRIRLQLSNLLLQQGNLNKDDVLRMMVTNDCRIQSLWSPIAVDLDEDASKKLLMDIVQLWLTIQGFSEASAYLESYKQCLGKKTKRYSGTRKKLKRMESKNTK